ncbi:MAG TPA: serine/threonine-protein kinase [Polyangiaceae bacterium]|nr:serine/threonine-protein kinase [Polyangiaceae bacterium]
MSFELERGSTLGNYELLVRIGRGGMASVWVARGRPSPDGPEQLVAIKAMLPELASNTEFRSMFLDEGQIVGSIDHPNVVKVYDVGEEEGILYMAMEWVEGDSLHTLIAEANKRRPIPPEVAVRLIADTAAGLHAAHELRGWDGQLREIVHCDVSPHNILIGLDGAVKLVDFGVAGAMNHINTEDEIKIRGKFGYMSPEQAQAKPLDRRSDVFSLGIVLFELTTGYRLFRGRDDRHTLELVTWGKIPRPSQVISRYPDQLESIVMRALDRDIERRFQTAEEFRDALESYLVEERILVPAAGVKGLLKRVLGSRIDQRRQQIRAAIKSLEGAAYVATTLVSEDTVVGDEEVVSVSVSQSDPPSNPSYSQSQASRDLGAAFLPGDGSSGVQTLSQPSPPPQKSNRFLLMGAVLGVVIAGAAVLVMRLGGAHQEAHELGRAGPPPSATPAAAPAPSEAPSEPTKLAEGQSLDTLPPDQPTALARPRAAGSLPAGKAATVERMVHDMEAMRAEQNTPAAKVTLTEEKDKDRVAAIANQVSLDDKGGDTQAPAASESDFDKATAQAQLTHVAQLVGTCRKAGSESGPGRALVTLATNGTPQNVTIQGKLSGTPVGDCVAAQFRGIHVAPFTGNPVTVSKAFVIADAPP